MKNTSLRSVGIILVSMVLLSILGACVSKQRYREQVDRSETLEKQLEEERARRTTLEEDIAVLKEHIEALEAEPGEASAEKSIEGIKKGFRALEEALGLAGKMGGEIEKGLRGNLKGLKERYEETLSETKKEIAKLKDRLESDEDLRKIRKEIRTQVAALLALIDEIDAGRGKD